ncbi:MAG: DNA polymerase III subunit gamma/tau [Hyphomicrobiaceae bacterium]|nr:DNA polymerase III subunit gamma/tau [Hyphomicrobiaceae bacterium]
MTDSFFSDAEVGTPKPYVVLARKYRPQSFDDLIGQEAMVATLRNAFEVGRIAQGYMLTGVRGVGKTTTARILARALNFEPKDGGKGGPTIDLPKDPAGYGRHCAEIMESRHADVVEMDAASNTGVDNVREIIESARYKPLVARYKVFIIDEVHMLSKGAFNALLKTLEEPPEHVKFIFATTEIRKVPVTVLSRCQRFDLRRIDVPLLTTHFEKIVKAEGAAAEPEALRLIARAAEGSVRDGLSILDQAIAFSKGSVAAVGVRDMLGLADRGRIFDLLENCLAGDPGQVLRAFADLHRDGAEPQQALTDLAEAVHLSTRVKAIGADAAGGTVSAEELRRAAAIAGRASVALLSRAWQMLAKGIEETSCSGNPVASAEMVLIRLVYTADLPGPEEIIRTLGGVPAKAAARQPAAPSTQPSPPASARNHTALIEASAAPAAAATSIATVRDDEGPPASNWQPDADPSLDDPDMGVDPDDPLYAETTPAGNDTLVPDPSSFAEVVDLVGARRDGKLKYLLEESVSLVRYDRATRSIDLHLLPGAPPEIANDLRERLKQATGRPWFVMLSRNPGEPPLGEVKRQQAAAELARLKSHPTVAAALAAFPDAEIAAIRAIPPGLIGDETGTG